MTYQTTRRGFTQTVVNKWVVPALPDNKGCSLRPLQAFSPTRDEENAARGFTLIELLIVVLIIGILAAVALPQYQKAIDKSNYGAIISVARSIESSQDAFYLEHGRYATDWDELDVSYSKDLPKNSEQRIIIGKGGFAIGNAYTSAIYFHGEDRIAAFTQYHRTGTNSLKGKAMCFSYKNSYRERAKAICLSFGGTLMSTASNCTSGTPCEYYVLHNI